VPCKDVHLKAADVMESYGFKTDLKAAKPYGFIHSLGHGVGLEIHEKPNLSPRSNDNLKSGHIVTVEPGLYYPEWGGIRIEDTLYITEDGYDDLATAEVFLEIE
ncbi:MAG: M24 family metallopeptidase, partial [Victivallales bacterium]|nr:M24 family metallopeptidase [Victivallales bacterium]